MDGQICSLFTCYDKQKAHLFQYVFGPFRKDKYHEALSALHREYGPLVKENIGGRVIVHVFDPEDIKGQDSDWKFGF